MSKKLFSDPTVASKDSFSLDERSTQKQSSPHENQYETVRELRAYISGALLHLEDAIKMLSPDETYNLSFSNRYYRNNFQNLDETFIEMLANLTTNTNIYPGFYGTNIIRGKQYYELLLLETILCKYTLNQLKTSRDELLMIVLQYKIPKPPLSLRIPNTMPLMMTTVSPTERRHVRQINKNFTTIDEKTIAITLEN